MTKYIVDGAYTYYDIGEASEAIISGLDEDVYDEMLDEVYGDDIDVCGIKYSPSLAFKRIDPTAYQVGMLDYFDTIQGEIELELERMRDGDCKNIWGCEVEVEDDGEEL